MLTRVVDLGDVVSDIVGRGLQAAVVTVTAGQRNGGVYRPDRHAGSDTGMDA
ncbi:hypothetical protein [Micromonospora sp. NBC_00898]|uniref:hypothetical protein n=1 Tax=Micromonospora sp. NBC_00898 TaxID=2975981 RepID=UPI0038633A00